MYLENPNHFYRGGTLPCPKKFPWEYGYEHPKIVSPSRDYNKELKDIIDFIDGKQKSATKEAVKTPEELELETRVLELQKRLTKIKEDEAAKRRIQQLKQEIEKLEKQIEIKGI